MNIVAAAAAAILLLGRAQPPPTADPAPTLEDLDAKAADVTSLKANFEREKHSDLLLDALVSSGRISVKEGENGGVRWDTLEPRPSTVIIAGGRVIAREGEGAAETHDVPESLAQLTASPRLQFTALERAFTITIEKGPSADAAEDEPDGERGAPSDPADKRPEAPPAPSGGEAETEAEKIHLTLTPADEDLRRFVEWVKVEVDPDTAVATRIEYADPDGDRTVLRFTRIEINPEIDESLFKPDSLRP
jgi:outer membrane lipoprotein-sorting protein